MQQSSIQDLLTRGLKLHSEGKLEHAKLCYEGILRLDPNNFDAYFLIASASTQQLDYKNAIHFLEKAIIINKKHPICYFNLGLIYNDLGRLNDSVDSYSDAVLIDPMYIQAYINRAELYLKLGKYHLALLDYEAALKLDTDIVNAHINRGVALENLNRYKEAVESYDKALILDNQNPNTHYNRGVALWKLKNYDEAFESYKYAIKLKPDHFEAYNNLGNTLVELNKFKEGIECYNYAIGINPNFAEAFNNRGNALRDLELFEQALESYGTAIRLKPDFAEALGNMGSVLQELNDVDKAIHYYEMAFAINENAEGLLGNLTHLKMRICEWNGLEKYIQKIVEKTKAGYCVSPPFHTLSLMDCPKTQKQITENFVDSQYKISQNIDTIKKYTKKRKIRIGYFSADFYNHAVGLLTAELFELHDRDNFEIFGFSYGPAKKDSLNLRIRKAFDSFEEVHDFSDSQISNLCRSREIDVAVDLGGHTKNSRVGIFVNRAAPIQISYIGYLGTMGSKYYDYLIADKTIIPGNYTRFYSEKIIYLPCFQVNDRKRSLGEPSLKESDFDLPKDCFKFCCMNSSYKITPQIFDVWMNILKAVKNSVLFLVVDNDSTELNLKLEAKLRDVNCERLIFTRRTSVEDYLARFQLFDLFLDTFPYNAGTTASDSLWAGLPVLTVIGKSFQSRVAASILKAIGLPELIAKSLCEYEALAIEFANDHQKLKMLKGRLLANRATGLLFDTPKFAKNLECAYFSIYERYHNNLPVEHINIEI